MGRLRVTVLFVQELIRLAGGHRVVYELPEGSRVVDLLERLPEDVKKLVYDPAKRELRWPAMVLVNGRRIEFLQGLDSPLRDGDVVLVSPRALFVV